MVYLTTLCDWAKKNSRPISNQSDEKLKSISTWSLAFSRVWSSFHGFSLGCYWLIGILSFILTDRCDFSGPGFTTFNRKALYWLIASPSSKNGLKRWATTCLLMITWQHTQPLPATVIKGSLLNMTWSKEQLAELTQ